MTNDEVPLVLLHGDPGQGQCVPVAGGQPIDLQRSEPLDAALLTVLLDSSVNLGVEVSTEMRRSFLCLPFPPLFQTSSWLCRHRPLIFEDGKVKIDDLEVSYMHEFGLILPE